MNQPVVTFDNNSGSVNDTANWADMTDINDTQHDKVGGLLTISISWFETKWNEIWGTKDTDDLIEGSSNFYDNSSWNQSTARDIFLENNSDIYVKDIYATNGNFTGNFSSAIENCYVTSDNSKFCENDLDGGWCQNGTTRVRHTTSNITKSKENGKWC